MCSPSMVSEWYLYLVADDAIVCLQLSHSQQLFMTGAGRLASGEEQSMMSSRMQSGDRVRVGVGMQTVGSS